MHSVLLDKRRELADQQLCLLWKAHPESVPPYVRTRKSNRNVSYALLSALLVRILLSSIESRLRAATQAHGNVYENAVQDWLSWLARALG